MQDKIMTIISLAFVSIAQFCLALPLSNGLSGPWTLGTDTEADSCFSIYELR